VQISSTFIIFQENAEKLFTFKNNRRLEIINPVLAIPALQWTTTTFSMSCFSHE